MKNYDYQKQLHAVWEKAVKLYSGGQRDASTYFSPEETAFLDSIGASAQEIYDFAEDYAGAGEPDFTSVAMMHDVRRSYFLEVQKGQMSNRMIDMNTLPAKDAEVEGIRWLPRIIPKAKVKLRGELDPDLMYGCGGDRNFFKEHDIHPAEFLRLVWANEDNEQAVIAWVARRSKTAAQESPETGEACTL